MSKKIIPFHVPANSDESPDPDSTSVQEITSADEWVHREEASAESAPADAVEIADSLQTTVCPVTITIGDTPNWFEAVKVGFFLPYLTVWVWTLSAAERNLRLFSR